MMWIVHRLNFEETAVKHLVLEDCYAYRPTSFDQETKQITRKGNYKRKKNDKIRWKQEKKQEFKSWKKHFYQIFIV